MTDSFPFERIHEPWCPANQAWDIPDACQCTYTIRRRRTRSGPTANGALPNEVRGKDGGARTFVGKEHKPVSVTEFGEGAR